MGSVYEKAKRIFDAHYIVEKLTADDQNRTLIKQFDGGEYGVNLAAQLVKNGWRDMEEGDSAYYLIKDKSSHKIASYFSLKAGLLWFAAVPRILEVSDIIGCKYAYLFAADKDYRLSSVDRYSLIEYYKNSFLFNGMIDYALAVIRPQYDEFCYEMYCEISELRNNRYVVWDRYADQY